MDTTLRRSWWLFLLEGILAVAFGIAALVWPQITLSVLVFLFGAYAFLDGLMRIFESVVNRQARDRWWLLLLQGVAGVVTGVLVFVLPGLSTLVLLLLIGAWAVILGILEIFLAIRLRRRLQGEWLMVLGGLAAIIFGISIYVVPAAGALAIVWLVAFFAILFGFIEIASGLRLRSGGGLSERHAT